MCEKLEFDKILEINEHVVFFEENDNEGFLVKKEENNELIKTIYSSFIVSNEIAQDQDGVIYDKIFVINKTAKEALLPILKDGEMTFWEAVLSIEDAFSSKQINHNKFRGDLAEAIFLKIKGGEKYYKTESADLILDGDLIEIKSHSLTRREITISNQQTNNEVQTYTVGLKFDNFAGKTLMQITEDIYGNEKFKKYIKKTYENTYVGEKAKYSINDANIKDITEFIKSLNLNEFIIEAKIRLI